MHTCGHFKQTKMFARFMNLVTHHVGDDKELLYDIEEDTSRNNDVKIKIKITFLRKTQC